MRTTSVLPGLSLCLFLADCHRPIKETVPLPAVPVPLNDVHPAPPLVESKTIDSEPDRTPTPVPVSSPGAAVAPVRISLNQLLLQLADAYFDFDQHDLREDARGVLRSDESTLKTIAAQAPDTRVVIEGHCDERGSAEYNLALGALRAETAKEFLVELGIPVATLKTATYGKERPQCTVKTEECWQRNRRAHLAPVVEIGRE